MLHAAELFKRCLLKGPKRNTTQMWSKRYQTEGAVTQMCMHAADLFVAAVTQREWEAKPGCQSCISQWAPAGQHSKVHTYKIELSPSMQNHSCSFELAPNWFWPSFPDSWLRKHIKYQTFISLKKTRSISKALGCANIFCHSNFWRDRNVTQKVENRVSSTEGNTPASLQADVTQSHNEHWPGLKSTSFTSSVVATKWESYWHDVPAEPVGAKSSKSTASGAERWKTAQPTLIQQETVFVFHGRLVPEVNYVLVTARLTVTNTNDSSGIKCIWKKSYGIEGSWPSGTYLWL